MVAKATWTGVDLNGGLEYIGKSIVKAVNDRLAQAAADTQAEARRRAPVEHGNLEDAIKVQSNAQRRQWSVYVDTSMPDDTGKYTIGDYAMWLHESVYELGKLSEQKAEATGAPVGPKYLESAFDSIANDDLVNKLTKIAAGEMAARAERRAQRRLG